MGSHNVFHCDVSGGALKEPVSVSLNDGTYYEGLSVDACVKTWLNGCSGCKYNIGLPFYGRSFAYATGFNQHFSGIDAANWPDGDAGTPEYWQIEKKFRQMVLKRDEKSHTEMGSFSDGSGLISFDDEEAICDKVEYGQTHNLNGY